MLGSAPPIATSARLETGWTESATDAGVIVIETAVNVAANAFRSRRRRCVRTGPLPLYARVYGSSVESVPAAPKHHCEHDLLVDGLWAFHDRDVARIDHELVCHRLSRVTSTPKHQDCLRGHAHDHLTGVQLGQAGFLGVIETGVGFLCREC